jgi:hypothetical protein
MANQPTVAELQALILQLQTQVQALENSATAAPIVQAAPAAAQVVFADTPQTLGTEDLIDYLSKRESDIYKQGIAPLDDKALTDGFNMTAVQTVHKPADCLLGKQHKDEQKKPYKANSATVASAATSVVNLHFAALVAAMANLDMNK